ncbi:hypothetical protein AGDE_17025 [Angomonas deanei]|nr:hypothetical protein AGDE_17025 [Angomonas deanei]|eukprot:EPY15671.1 hypothetical protein AGDE_17025 [Angomonas deanei]
MELYPSLSLCHFWLVLYQASMTDTVPVAQWIALQTEVNTLQRENRELQAENRVLQGKLNDLLNEKMTWLNEKVTLVEEKSALREERITLQNKYDNLRKKHDELVEEHRDYAEEMININTRLKQELEEALAEKEESKRQMHVIKEMCDFRLCLTENCYNCMAGQFDLIKVFKYYKENTISVYSIREILNSDRRETLNLPKRWKSSVGDANVKEFFATIVAALPNLKSITGYFTSIEDCYIQYKRDEVPREVLEVYCGNYGKTTYELTNNTILAIESSELSVSEYLATVIPLLPEVMSVSVYESNITTLDWCAALPDSIIRIDISDCPNLKDCTPLLKRKGLKVVFYNSKTNPSFNAVKEQLKGKGVPCKPLHPY